MKGRYAIPREDLKYLLVGFGAGSAAFALALFLILSVRLVGA